MNHEDIREQALVMGFAAADIRNAVTIGLDAGPKAKATAIEAAGCVDHVRWALLGLANALERGDVDTDPFVRGVRDWQKIALQHLLKASMVRGSERRQHALLLTYAKALHATTVL